MDFSVLSKGSIRLEPLLATHAAELLAAATDGELWCLPYTSVPGPTTDSVYRYIHKALEEQRAGHSIPFAVYHMEDDRIIGSTRFCNIQQANRKLEIGYTWYGKHYWRTAINTTCKYLLLQKAFEKLDCIAVEFRTHHQNIQSQKAIERLGAKLDGILRNDRIMPDGTIRHTKVYSILNVEWPTIKSRLESIV